MTPRIVLASASPRRRELLAQIGVDFEVMAADVEEAVRPGESPEAYVRRVAMDKATAVAGLTDPERWILAADTEVVLDGEVLGKPRDFAHFQSMARRLSGREHQVLSAVVLRRGAECDDALSLSAVSFRDLSERDIADYWRTGEPLDKAGGYAVQGLGAIFVSRLCGSYSGVMGLPLHETARLLATAGIHLLPGERAP
ncbi:MAG: septum formation inhibitor Maf [Methylococcaceae bacterium]|nr:septum formation inhibitor Maf [Methylococcaceae bacterium]